MTITGRINPAGADVVHTDVLVLRKYRYQQWAAGVQRWKVVYTAGFTADTAPSGLKHAILDLVYRGYTNRGSKSQQSAAGYGYSWQEMAGSDLMSRIRKYSYRSRIIG